MQSIEASHALDGLDRDVFAALVCGFWQERLVHSEAAIRGHTHPDVVFRIIGAPGSQSVNFHVGVEAVVDAVRLVDTNLQFLSFTIVDLIVDGRFVGLRWQSRLRHRGTGVEGELSVFDLIEISDGKFVSYTEFLDTDGFVRLMTGEPQPNLSRRSNTTAPPLVRSAAPPTAMPDAVARGRVEAMLRGFWEERWRDGSACLRNHCTDDCTIHLVGDVVQVPFARSHVGIDAVCSLIDQIDMEFACEDFHILHALVDGERAALHWTADLRHRGTGARGVFEAFDHIVLEGDRIKSITGFFDTAATARLITG
jgi:ketosteroid isomerase-like protein